MQYTTVLDLNLLYCIYCTDYKAFFGSHGLLVTAAPGLKFAGMAYQLLLNVVLAVRNIDSVVKKIVKGSKGRFLLIPYGCLSSPLD